MCSLCGLIACAADDVVRDPVIYTNYLAQRVFEKFGLDGDAIPGRERTIQGGAGDT